MNKALKNYILSLNCSIVTPIQKSITNKETVGWLCKSSSILRKDTHYRLIEDFIKENNINYYLSGWNQNNTEFYIYINPIN